MQYLIFSSSNIDHLYLYSRVICTMYIHILVAKRELGCHLIKNSGFKSKGKSDLVLCSYQINEL